MWGFTNLPSFYPKTVNPRTLIVTEQITLKKSSLLLQMQNTQILQLVTKIIKTESIYKK